MVKSIKVTAEPIRPELYINSFINKEHGALVTFLGIVRSVGNDGKPVTHLVVEPVGKDAENKLSRIVFEIASKYGIESDSIIIHRRIGKLSVGEIALFVGVSAIHRQEAFNACEEIVDAIKSGDVTREKDIYQ